MLVAHSKRTAAIYWSITDGRDRIQPVRIERGGREDVGKLRIVNVPTRRQQDSVFVYADSPRSTCRAREAVIELWRCIRNLHLVSDETGL